MNDEKGKDKGCGYIIALILVIIFGGLAYAFVGVEGLLKWLTR